MTNAEKILNAIEANRHNYCYFGVRVDSKALNIGDTLECSHNFDTVCDDDSELLGGTCATGFGMLWFDGEQDDIDTINRALEINAAYDRKNAHKYLIGGWDSSYGNDPSEVIIAGAEVVEII